MNFVFYLSYLVKRYDFLLEKGYIMKKIDKLLPTFFEKQVGILIENYLDNSVFNDDEINEIKIAFNRASQENSQELELVRGDILSLIKNDPALSGKDDKREVLFYPGVKARFFHQVAHNFYKQEKYLQARAISESAKSITNIEIHPGAIIGERLTIDHGMGIVIGETAEIGNDVVLFHGVTIGGTGKQVGKRHPTIGNDVFIGSHSVLLGSINVGDNAKIGANSTILRDVPAQSTFCGTLARIKKYNNVKLNFKEYWENYYKEHQLPFKQSSFAEFILNYLEPHKKMIELGCGNGRDAVFFAERENVDVLAIDQAENEVDFLNKNFKKGNLRFVTDDFTKLSIKDKFDYVYSRFTLHSITEEQENNVLKWVNEYLNTNGLFFIEVRSINDDMYNKGKKISRNENITDHYRRYMNIDVFTEKVKGYGLKVVYSVESNGLAVHNDDDPVIIRLIVKKVQ
ncbi:MAG: methyltransferase domain-containing protein [Rickettsiales bacterium]|jgi:serine O-acetyltransferase|nr:methyltransferase domain-containing protein [Rickettsiales bacterium]